MKKIFAFLMAFIMLIAASPISANANIQYSADENFVSEKINDVVREIMKSGKTDTADNKYICYRDELTQNEYKITVEKATNLLRFDAQFVSSGDRISFHYSFPDIIISANLVTDSDEISASVILPKLYTYAGEDLNFSYEKDDGTDVFNTRCNDEFKASLEGFDNCLYYNISVNCCLWNIGFCSLPGHSHNFRKYITPATLAKSSVDSIEYCDGIAVHYCIDCGLYSFEKIPAVTQVSLSRTKYTYNGKAHKPTVTIKDRNGNNLPASGYTVNYQANRKEIGKYTVRVNFKGRYSGAKVLYFTVVPEPTKLTKIIPQSKSFTVKWKKQATKTTGYQIQFSTDKHFKSKTKTVTIKSNKTITKRISKLKGKKKYYVRIRTYKTVDKTRYYSSWSKSKTVTTKQ